jgi:hypothetical protein
VTTSSKRKNSPMAPYFVQMREFERRLIRGAIEEAETDIDLAATMLGVTKHYVLARAKLLGGVIGNEPKHEPPGRAAVAWSNTISAGKRQKRKVEESEEIEEPAEPADVSTIA